MYITYNVIEICLEKTNKFKSQSVREPSLIRQYYWERRSTAYKPALPFGWRGPEAEFVLRCSACRICRHTFYNGSETQK